MEKTAGLQEAESKHKIEIDNETYLNIKMLAEMNKVDISTIILNMIKS